jgi:hypothetical protein
MMLIWIVVAVFGGLLSLVGFLALVRRFRRGEIRRRQLLAYGAGLTSFVSAALLNALRPTDLNSSMTVILLLPALVAIVLIVRERQINQ